MSPHKIVKRIASLLRQAENGKDHEDERERQAASVAQKIADQLMAKHNVEVELDALDEGRDDPLLGERMVMFLARREDSQYAQFLLGLIVPLYWCSHKSVEVDAGWTFYVVGPPGQIEPCAIHFEFLRRKMELIANMVCSRLRDRPRVPGTLIDPRTGRFGKPFGSREEDGVHWGVMDGLYKNLEHKHAHKTPPVVEEPSEDLHTVTQLDSMLALPPAAEQFAVRGTEIAIRGEEFGLGGESPDDVVAPEPPYWAYQTGMSAVGFDEDPEPPEIIYQPPSALDISERVAETLIKAAVHTIAQLVRMRPADVFAIDGIGEDDVVELVHVLGDNGLFFPPDWEEVV